MQGSEPTLPAAPASTLPGGASASTLGGGTGDADASVPLPGTRIGNFVVERLLGAGAMGVVLLARDEELDRHVAIKLLSPRHEGDARAHQRLLREAQSVARLQHPNVVAVHQVGTLHDRVYVVMEYVDGGTLRQWVAAQPRGWAEIVDVYLQAAAGLAAAHAAGLVHRDFKPDNVLIGGDGRVRVSDFGLVTGVGDDSRSGDAHPVADIRLTQTGAVLGTPAYMAPEQFAGVAVDARADQFALCVSLFEALHGKRPFAGDHPMQLLAAIERGAVEPIVRADVPPPIQGAIVRGLAAHPVHRHPSIAALARALSWRSAVVPRTPTSTATLAIAIGAAVFVLATIGTGAFLWSRQVPPTSPGVVADCDGERELAGIWDEGARNEMRTAFVASGSPIADDAFQRSAMRLDAYHAAFVDISQRSCEAAIDDALTGRRDDCLSAARDAFAGVVDVLRRPSSLVVVESAVAIVGELPSLPPCIEPDALARRAAEPTTEQLAEVGLLRRALWRVHALFSAGETEPGARELALLQARIDALAYPPVRTLASMLSARARTSVQDAAGAESHLRAAISSARASSDPTNEALALAELVHLLAVSLARTDEALALLPQLHDAFDRAESDPRWYMHTTLAPVFMAAGRAAEADAEATAAVDLLAASPWPRPDAQAIAHTNRGRVRAKLGRGAEALADLETARTILVEAFGPNHPMLARSVAVQGFVRASLGDVDGARASFAEAERILAPLAGANRIYLADLLLSVGDMERHANRQDEAAAALRRALAIQESLGRSEHAGRVLVEIAGVEYMRGRFEDAAHSLRRAAEIVAAHPGGTVIDPVRIEHLQGGVAHALGDDTRGLEHHRRRLKLLEQRHGPSHPTVAVARIDIGDFLRLDGECDEARAEYARASRIRTTHEAGRDADEVRILVGIGHCDVEDDRLAVAAHGLAQAREVLARVPATDAWVSAPVEFLAAVIAEEKGDLVAARASATTALAAYEAMGPGFSPEAEAVRDWIALELD